MQTQETTSTTIKGTIFNDASFNWSNILVSADHLNIKCTTTGNKLQATGTWHAITKFRYTLKEKMQRFVKSKKLLSVNSDAVHEGVKQVSTLNNDQCVSTDAQVWGICKRSFEIQLKKWICDHRVSWR